MRRSPRRPLILKRRKLPFHQSDPPGNPHASVARGEPASSSAPRRFPDGIRVLDHPVFPGTQVVFIPKTAELRSVIEALTIKGKERGVQGPNKFILLGDSGSLDLGSLCQTDDAAVFPASAAGQQASQSATFNAIERVIKKEDVHRFDESLTDTQRLERSDAPRPGPGDDKFNKENRAAVAVLKGGPNILDSAREPARGSPSEALKTAAAPKPSGDGPKGSTFHKLPFTYVAMIQFAINSTKNGRMTLKEIYKWLQEHFHFFKDENKPWWKNSIRHNLSLHEMFVRKPSPDPKVSYWTIRPEANRGLTLDRVYTPGCHPVASPFAPQAPSPHQQTPSSPKKQKKPMKALLPRTPSYLVPVQLPVQLPLSPAVCVTPTFMLAPPPARQAPSSTPKAKRSRGPPKVALAKDESPQAKLIKVEPECRSPKPHTRKQQAGNSRRKQSLARWQHEEPLLMCSQDSEADSGIATLSACPDAQADVQEWRLHSCCETPVKAARHLDSSTPSKPLPDNCGQSALDFSPIRTPGGPARTPMRDYTTFGLNSAPFKDWPLFSDASSPDWQSARSRELLPGGGGGTTPPTANRSLTEGLVLDTNSDSLSKILLDFGLDEVLDVSSADVSLSEIIQHFK
ncbi:forkhead box protein M1 isoform X2 [Syngnathoides biaculeatus]|uniref:forkhead box protein M1 isoform X2 n=1 Tax=Syngnathoides biaculeatus TaxID=300417 RepID=UPI002ADE2815|nr:forkhead box protein M1 isoform X2 [Syngnathoides biaculeatus]